MIEFQPTTAVRNRTRVQSTGLSTTRVIIVTFLCLLIGHLAIKEFFGSVLINGVGILLVTCVLYWVLFLKRDPFSFLLIIFICSQFLYANNQGGLFNLVTFVLLLPYLLTKNYKETRQSSDAVLNVLLVTLLATNMLGLFLRNPVGIVLRIQQAATFSGFLMAFLLASHLRLDAPRLKKMMAVIGIFVCFNFMVSINQHYSIIKLASPMLGLEESLFYAAENAFGTFRSASANAQYAMIIFAFIVPLLSSTAARIQLALNPVIYIGVCLICMSLTVLANMRAAAVFIGLLTMMYSVMFAVFYRRSFRYAKYLNRFTIAAVVFLFVFGAIIGIQNITSDFQEAASASSEQVLSGEVFNRLGAWEYGIDLLSRESWIIGYGHGGKESNMIATGAVRTATGWRGGGHMHSLYLMLPVIYGWIGSVAFMGLFFVPLMRAFRIVRKLSFDNMSVVVNLSFMVSLGIWLLDEIKSGNIVQTINYTMLAFIWLGWTVAAQRTLRFNAILNRKKN